jgi:hypothetical protein
MLELITTISVMFVIIFGILFQIVLSDLSHEKEQRQRTSAFYEELRTESNWNLAKIFRLENENTELIQENKRLNSILDEINTLSFDEEEDEEDDD